MAEIVLEFASVVFRYVESFVLDFPARPAASDDLGDIVFETGRLVTQAMEDLTFALGVDNFEADPVDQHGVLAVAQRNGLDPAVTERLFRIATADFLLVTAELGSVDEVVERLVRSRLAGEDEIVAGVGHHLGDGMAGEQIVAKNTGRNGASRALCFSNQPLTALRSQSCFSAPS